MPQDPRHGNHGHQRSHSRPEPQDDSSPATPSSSGRRRRSLGDDGTGGTRVVDLLAAHGKTPGSASHHRRQAEPAEPEADRSSAQPAQPSASARPPRGTPQAERRSEWSAPPERTSRPPTGRSRTGAPSPGRQADQGPSAHSAPPAPNQSAATPSPSAQQPPAPPSPPAPASPPAPNATPSRSQRSSESSWFPPASPSRTPQTPGRGTVQPNRSEHGTGPRPEQRGESPRPAEGARPERRDRRYRDEAPTNGVAAPSDNEKTQITQALSGERGAPPESPAARQFTEPAQAPRRRPNTPPVPPERPAQERPAQERAGQEPRGQAAPRRPRPPQPPSPDLEATTQHPAVPPVDPSMEETVVAAIPPADRKPAGPPTPADAESGSAAATALTRLDPAGSEKTSDGKTGSGKSGADEADPFDDEDDERPENDSDEVKAIDATLARFSAVHDQIAVEEAERRKKYSWLFGKRRNPELGRDIPFEFTEGRDAEQSRMEWKQKQRKRRTIRIIQVVAVAAALMVFVAAGIGWSAKSWVDAQFKEVAALDPNSSSIKHASQQNGDLNLLLLGSDTRAGASAADGVGTVADEPGARADSTLVAHIPADRSRVLIVSFPRDLEVDIPSCERWDPNTGKYTGEQLPPQPRTKLNQAYATGGPKCTTKVVQQLSGLSITNFLGVDFQGFKSMVDAVRGVEICSSIPIVDSKLGVVLPEAGRQNLNGTQALNYVRARYVERDPTADYGRMQRQQLFLSALLRKAMSGQVLLDPRKLTEFVNAVAANTFGENVGTEQLFELGRSLQGLDAEKVTFITVPTVGTANENGNEELRKREAAELFRGIIEGAPVTSTPTRQVAESQPAGGGSSAAPAARPAPTVQPAEVPVQVFNTTGESGLAGRTSTQLAEAGFAVSGAGQLDAPAQQTVIRHSAANAEAARLLASSLPGAVLVEDAAAGPALSLELGEDFDGTVVPPAIGPAHIPENLSTVNAGKDVCG